MKTTFALILLLASGQSHALFNFDKEPKELEKLKEQKIATPTYTSFSEIAPVTPLPAKFRFKIGTLLRMALFKQQVLPYDIVEPKEYSSLENNIHEFFKHPGGQTSLKLLSYSRQINAGQPYQINSFLPYFTIRKENELVGNEKVGPAAVVHELFDLRSKYEGELQYMTPKGELRKAEVKYKEKALPRSGNMFLFDHEIFSLKELINNPKQNILQDVILHEFTHIWHSELLSKSVRNKSTVASNMTENGHDTMIVSNPSLAFSEGLAEGFEALYGTAASKILNMSKEERRRFFGNYNAKLSKGMQFLANRQTFVRRNSYLYNLYDASNCSLRSIKGISAAEIGVSSSFNAEDFVARVLRGEEINVEDMIKVMNWENFSDRFYSDEGYASTTDLAKNCQIDSPARLESKEGFVATLIYNLVASGAMIPTQVLHEMDLGQNGKKPMSDKAWWKSYQAQSAKWQEWMTSSTRAPASERAREAEKVFLLSFRSLVEAVKASQATTITDLIKYLISNPQDRDTDKQMRVAYQLLKVTKGSLLPEDASYNELRSLFKNPGSISRGTEAISDSLRELVARGDLSKTYSKFTRVPEVYVSYPSKLSGGAKKRLNLNVAHHIDLIDLFGENSKEVAALASRLSKGAAFRDDAEAINFAASIGKASIIQKAIADAEVELKEVRKLEDMGQQIMSHF